MSSFKEHFQFKIIQCLLYRHRIKLLVVFVPTDIMQVQGNIFVLEERVIVEAAPLDLLEEGADVPAVQHLQQHDAGDPQTHVQNRLHTGLHRHGQQGTEQASTSTESET